MGKRLIASCFVSSCFVSMGLLLAVRASAQEVVHALSGTMTSVNPQTKTLVVNTDDGSGNQFNMAPEGNNSLDFNRTIKDEVKPASSLDKPNDEVIVFFYGNSSVRSAVAVQDLGAGPFLKTQGTVVKVNKHDHTLVLKNSSGAPVTLHIDPHAVADASDGVVPGDRFDPGKGDTVYVIASKANGVETALFMHE